MYKYIVEYVFYCKLSCVMTLYKSDQRIDVVDKRYPLRRSFCLCRHLYLSAGLIDRRYSWTSSLKDGYCPELY